MSMNKEKTKCFKCGALDYYTKITCCGPYYNRDCLAAYHEMCLTLVPDSGLIDNSHQSINCYWLCSSCNRYRTKTAHPSFLMHQQQILGLEKLNTNIVQGFERVNNNLEKGLLDLGNKMHCDMDQLRNDVSQEIKHMREKLSVDLQQLNSGMSRDLKLVTEEFRILTNAISKPLPLSISGLKLQVGPQE